MAGYIPRIQGYDMGAYEIIIAREAERDQLKAENDQLRQELEQIKAEYYSEGLANTRAVIEARQELAACKAELADHKAASRVVVGELRGDLAMAARELAACKAEHAQCLKDKNKLIGDLVAANGRLEWQLRMKS
jgi:ribosomal protein L29